MPFTAPSTRRPACGGIRDRSRDFSVLDYWTDLPRILERGKFDALFIANGMAFTNIYGGNAYAALRSGRRSRAVLSGSIP